MVMKADGDRLRMAFTGDVALGPMVHSERDKNGSGAVFRSIGPTLKDVDMAIINFEGFVSNGCDTARAKKKLAVHPALCNELVDGGVSVACLANNHIMDGGHDGLEETQESLRGLGIGFYGAGSCRASAEAPFYFESNGLTGAIVGACDYSPYHAGRRRPGVAPMVESALLKRVARLRKHRDVVIVTLHADLEFTPYPAPWRIRLCRALVDAGAMLVIQHHPHVIQGVDEYNGGVIAYSLGNTVFPIDGNHYQERREGVREGLIFLADIRLEPEGPKLTWSAVPHRITPQHFPELLGGSEARQVMRRFRELCAGLDDSDLVRRIWRARSRGEVRAGLWNAYWKLRRHRWRAAAEELKRLLLQSELRRLWLPL